MRERAKVNAMRSGVVVVGALAFGYLTLRLGFKPFLERAQQSQDQLQSPPLDHTHDTDDVVTTEEFLPTMADSSSKNLD